MPQRLSVVVSQGQSNHSSKRAVEEKLVAWLLGVRGIDVSVVSHLVDLTPDSSGMMCLSGITGDLVVCAWLYPRATQWILDRNGIRGRVGNSAKDETAARSIYCLDLRTHDRVEPYMEEIKRIAQETATETVNGTARGSARTTTNTIAANPQAADETPPRRWYPVIDYSRCTNCLECIDFCLFGVYGIDEAETILVEQPDLCRKGCPACSRICPENAIIFPQHKSPAIAGSLEVDSSTKLDLSMLFGAPDGQKAEDVAARERNEYLLAAGHIAVRESTTRDDLDSLIDQLDAMDI